MKLEGLDAIVQNQPGSLTITPEVVEDFWSIANAIHVGDIVFSQVRRKIVHLSSSGKTNSKNIITKASIFVTEIDYQPNVDEMNIRGTLVEDLENVRAGSFQRVLLRIGSAFTLTKKCWDQFSLDELREAADPIFGSEVSAVVMQLGVANICIIGRNTTIVTHTITKTISKIKTADSVVHSKEQKQKFFQSTAEALIHDVDVEKMKVIIIASPGFTAEEFLHYLRDKQNTYRLSTAFRDNKFILASVSNGYPQEIQALLLKPDIASRIGNIKAATQAQAYDHFLRTLNNDPKMVTMGPNVMRAADLNAIDTLLVTDNYIKSQKLEDRIRFLDIKDRMEKTGTKVIVFSIKHQTGEQLDSMGGLAAILRYQLDLDDFVDDEDVGFDE